MSFATAALYTQGSPPSPERPDASENSYKKYSHNSSLEVFHIRKALRCVDLCNPTFGVADVAIAVPFDLADHHHQILSPEDEAKATAASVPRSHGRKLHRTDCIL
jgi:hypothetical protein